MLKLTLSAPPPTGSLKSDGLLGAFSTMTGRILLEGW